MSGLVGAHLATWEPAEIKRDGGEMEMKRLSPEDTSEPAHEAVPEAHRCLSSDMNHQLPILTSPGN